MTLPVYDELHPQLGQRSCKNKSRSHKVDRQFNEIRGQYYVSTKPIMEEDMKNENYVQIVYFQNKK